MTQLENDFLTQQKKYERVRTALSEKEELIKKTLAKQQLTVDNIEILIQAFKKEEVVELYAKAKNTTKYNKIATYSVCQSSGELGPKRKKGDYQVPEGFYHIDRFNPMSNFYLSLGINYPNTADRIKSTASDLGGDIFIHGACVSIGCLPITDDYIKELYVYAVHAKNNGQQKIPVYIFPFRLTDENMTSSNSSIKENPTLLTFWKNLKLGYDLFAQHKKSLHVKVNDKGDYTFH